MQIMEISRQTTKQEYKKISKEIRTAKRQYKQLILKEIEPYSRQILSDLMMYGRGIIQVWPIDYQKKKLI